MSTALPRVIFVNRVYWPAQAATAQLLVDLAEGLAAAGWPVHVIAAGDAAGPHNGVTVHRTGAGERHGGLVSRLLNYVRFIRGARQLLSELILTGDVVVVMTDPPMLGAALSGTIQRGGARAVHWIQDIYPEIVTAHLGVGAMVPLWPLRVLRDFAWQSARHCVVLGEAMKKSVTGRNVPAKNISILANWAPRELQLQPTFAEVAAQRAAWGVADKFVVAYSGNLGRVHEFAAILTAAAILQSHPEFVFLFIGAGARFDEVRAEVQAKRLGNVRFLPPEPRANLAAALAGADAQLVTLKPEFAGLVFPSKLAGVLAAGRPVLFVGPPGGEIARLLVRTPCGAAFAPDDGARLALTLQQWHVDPELRRQLGQRARATYEQHFAFDPALVRWQALLLAAGTNRNSRFA